MARLLVTGGKRLVGEVPINGAKNSVLALMVTAALGQGESVIDNVPYDRDVATMSTILKELGVRVAFEPPHRLRIDGSQLNRSTAPYEPVRQMRASFYVAGLLLARLGKAEVPLPGGCQLGSRPVDFHLRGFEALGAKVQIEHGFMKAEAPRLRGTSIFINRSSVGTTVNLMLAASLADGVTVLENAAKEPEIVDQAILLNQMGARVRGAGTDVIRIEGVPQLHPAEHTAIPDRIEAGTYMMAAAITGGRIVLEDVEWEHFRTPVVKLQEAGVRIERVGPTQVLVESPVNLSRDVRLRPVDVETAPYPGFPTDLQQPLVALLTLADGTSVVRETIFDRFRYVDELRRMGADVRVERDTAVVRGVRRLTGAPVEAMDLRAGAALVIAALAAEGQTRISGVELIDRGYEHIEAKLNALGADVVRVDDEGAPASATPPASLASAQSEPSMSTNTSLPAPNPSQA
ncbi:MAG: UDP-N-acetylglucosamine 1-carboxyvinyltransferase [Limnochordaceae bacterium]|nr:UDP-N-acetylglucosamine 1-carboxyvinyltransferase [Limnochordaceae bacterium]